MKKLILGLVGLAVALAFVLKPDTSDAISPEFLAMAKQSVVRVSILGTGTCSATVVSKSEAVTAGHCIPSTQNLFAFMLQGGAGLPMFVVGKGISVTPRGLSPQVDAAVIVGDFSQVPAALDVDHNTGEIFRVEEAVLCGYPFFNDELRCTRAKRVGNKGFAAAFDAVAIPGQSGGAVFSLEGKLIGIVFGVDKDGLTYAASTTGVLSLK